MVKSEVFLLLVLDVKERVKGILITSDFWCTISRLSAILMYQFVDYFERKVATCDDEKARKKKWKKPQRHE
ncbi:hypothetical protein L6452_19827 [Arctium lappa]|uniref:Uncharacterized protein n=1 Tax=Arctium lappa TaxID=4217 RepID=A0ACB9B8X4_ARCLA|nr:hypothetical protein L6452_19827 [Arctium lappa]